MVDVGWLVLAFALGVMLGLCLTWRQNTAECADCHVGSIKREWWAKAVAGAEFRKAQKEKI